jgi:hypothetical protein
VFVSRVYNLTVQIIRIDDLPQQDADEIYQQLTELPFPPILEARAVFDGYKIIRTIHASSRSHIYLAVDIDVLGYGCAGGKCEYHLNEKYVPCSI